ncbi:MAG: helix-turn-helix transcriptional regulator [Lachnospiraceae bacterium]|nr:helix-turn-helix transcriptional regulator [Lachnospiraceae bacterium]
MIDDILNYIRFLEEQYDFSISIHAKERGHCKVIDRLIPYNIHRNPYCLFITSDKQRHSQCVDVQQKIRENCQCEIFYMNCMCGVGQYVLPVKYGSDLLGFICVSGYGNAPEKCLSYAGQANLSADMLAERYHLHLKPEIPAKELVRLLVKPLASMLTVFFLQHPEENNKPDADSALYHHILSVIHANLDRKLTIEDIAAACYCSPSMVSHLFKKKSGTTINRYLNSLRMEKARQLLTDTNLSITEIAYTCGFCDANYFISVFSKAAGMPPLQFRKCAVSSLPLNQFGIK